MLSPPKFENEKMVSDTKLYNCPGGLWLTANQLNYAKGSPERAELTKTIKKLKGQFPFTIPITINGSDVRGNTEYQFGIQLTYNQPGHY
jgi:1-pyrroline-5-carboxylate dehydrogenase